jgi:outer membrane protein TolC
VRLVGVGRETTHELKKSSLAWTYCSYVIGLGISWAAFNLGRVRAQVAQAHARNDVALATYEKTVLGAPEETENGLVTHARARDRLTHVAAAAEASAIAARTRYEGGYVISSRFWMPSERSSRPRTASHKAGRRQPRA